MFNQLPSPMQQSSSMVFIFFSSLTIAVLARKKYKPHPNKISSMLFYQATIIIHGSPHCKALSDGRSLQDKPYRSQYQQYFFLSRLVPPIRVQSRRTRRRPSSRRRETQTRCLLRRTYPWLSTRCLRPHDLVQSFPQLRRSGTGQYQ
jgi:hypothetical protein